MKFKKLRIHETLRVFNGNNKQDAVDIGDRCAGITVRCLQDSGGDIYVGWNEPASPKNILKPGDNITFGNIEGTVLDGNTLYVSYANANSRALVSIINYTGQEC